jgi:hypothetical protein
MKITLKRISDDGVQTLGHLHLGNGKVYQTLELAWKNNERQQSCIPKGVYKVRKRTSAKYGEHFHILNVPNRDMILIHHANFHNQLLGCIAPGKGLADLNKDGRLDVTSSRQAMKEMLAYLPNTFELEIV